MYKIGHYVKKRLLCTLEVTVYFRGHYVLQRSLCTLEVTMYIRGHYVHWRSLCTLEVTMYIGGHYALYLLHFVLYYITVHPTLYSLQSSFQTVHWEVYTARSVARSFQPWVRSAGESWGRCLQIRGCTVEYCTASALHCTALHCRVLHCNCTALHCTAL